MCAAHDRVVKNNIKKSLLNLKTVLNEDVVLGQYHFEDAFLIRFLYGSNFHISIALQKITDYHGIMFNNTELFIHPRPENLRHLKIRDKVFLNDRDKSGRKILMVKIGNLNVRATSPEEQILLFNLLVERVVDDALTLENGLSVILDVHNFSWKLLQWLTPHNVKLGTKLIENYPIKEVLVHVVNKSYTLQIGVKIVWPFLSDYRKEMIKFHFTNWSSLHEYVDSKILPVEYGGSGPDLNFDSNDLLEDVEYITKKIKQNMRLKSI